MTNTEKETDDGYFLENISWWVRHKNKVVAAVLVVVGVLGGNTDRLMQYIPNLVDLTPIHTEINELREEMRAELMSEREYLDEQINVQIEAVADLSQNLDALLLKLKLIEEKLDGQIPVKTP